MRSAYLATKETRVSQRLDRLSQCILVNVTHLIVFLALFRTLGDTSQSTEIGRNVSKNKLLTGKAS